MTSMTAEALSVTETAPATAPTPAPAPLAGAGSAVTAKVTRRPWHPRRKPPVSPRKDDQEFFKFSRRILRAYARRVAAGDPMVLSELANLRAEVDAAIAHGALSLHEDQQFSWAEIGTALGIPRQDAWRKYSPLARIRRSL